jgi:hypothetical protein
MAITMTSGGGTRMDKTPRLSKSKLISGWQCGKRLWLEKNAPEHLQYSDATEVAFQVGHRVGDVAQSLFPGGVLIGHDEELSLALDETQDRLSRPGAQTLYEATFDYDGVLIRADIFSRAEDGTCRLVEVKAATKLKEYYLYDCAIQLWVLENLGYEIDRLELAHINNQFVYAGDEDYEGLLTYVDVLDQARALQAEVVNLIDSMRDILRSDEPNISMGKQCTTPFECPAYQYCLGPQPEMPVSWLPGGKTAANKLIKAGYKDIRDIPKGYLENDTAEMCRKVAVSGAPKLDSQAACVSGYESL